MTKRLKSLISFILVSVICFSSLFVSADAAVFDDINIESVFLKQETAITCTLSSATMMLRRTAIIAGFTDWAEITEPNIRDTAWVDGVGLRWDFSFYGMSVGHGYYPSDTDKKLFMIDLLDKFPQGVVVYNTGKKGQNHAIFLCDYDESADIFYVCDPATTVPEGRIPLSESSIVGDSQDDKIANLSAYWYVSTPEIKYENGTYKSSSTISNPYDPTHDSYSFDQSKTDIHDYYVVNYDSTKGVALRYYPSGSSSAARSVTKGTILYVTYKGKNNFGAEWYKINTGHYIFNTNLIPFEEYSDEIKKFNNTAVVSEGTYKASSKNGTVYMRIDPTEGNNVVSEIDNDEMLYITHSGDNSVGAKWLKTQDGYYVKADDMTFVTRDKLKDSLFNGTYMLVSGDYSATPSENDSPDTPEKLTGKYKITASALNLRKDAVNGEVYISIPKDTVVDVVAISDGWGKTSYEGYVGWILLDYAEKVQEDRYKIESMKLSSDVIETGREIVCTANVSGGDKPRYLFSVFNDAGKQVYKDKDYSEKNTCSFKTSSPGSYYFFVEIVDGDKEKISAFSRNFTVHDKLQIDSVKSNVDGYTYISDEITWTVSASSVSSDAVYVYSLYCDDELLFEKESRFKEFSYIPEKPGQYILYAKLSDSNTESEALKADIVNVYDSVKITKIHVPMSDVVLNSSVKITADASGGTGEYLYCFMVFKDDSIVKSGLFTSEKTDTIVFDSTGKYVVFCTVMDSSNMIASAFSEEFNVVDAKKGDVDSDGTITAKDARLVLRHSAKIEILNKSGSGLADVNNDEVINASDARLILRCAAKLETL